MEFVYVYRDDNGEITGSSTQAENGEKMSIDNPEYVAFLNKVYPLQWDQIRSKRDALLKESDWIGLSDVNIASKEAWVSYRQELRDIPQKYTNSEEVIWPNKPE